MKYVPGRRVPQSYAIAMVARAVRDGVLPVPTTCVVCGHVPPIGARRKIHYHHWSYRFEHVLSVSPVCASCHRRIHTGKIPDPITGQTNESASFLRSDVARLEHLVARLRRDAMLAESALTVAKQRKATIDAWVPGNEYEFGQPNKHRTSNAEEANPQAAETS